MNEKELRDAWRSIEKDGDNFPAMRNDDAETVFDWFIARIKERDQRLKEKMTAKMKEYRRTDGYKEAFKHIINLFDNHA